MYKNRATKVAKEIIIYEAGCAINTISNGNEAIVKNPTSSLSFY